MSPASSSAGPSWPTIPLERRLPGLALLLRRLPWAALAAVIGLAVGLGVGQVRDRVYESTTYITVISSSDGADASSIARAAQALSRVATAPDLISEPLREAGLTAAAEQPRMFITVEAAPDAPLISVTGRASDPERAQAIAATVADTLAGVENLGPFQAFAVADPSLPRSPSTPVWLVPAGGAGLGLAVGMVLAATVPARRNALTTPEREAVRAELPSGTG
jgi:capsular polysaccharide biosynthesis protein